MTNGWDQRDQDNFWAETMLLAFLRPRQKRIVYKESEYRDWITNAGLVDIIRQPQVQGRSLMTARKA